MDFLLTPRALPDADVEVPEAGNRCKLMSNFAIIVQLLLATIAFSTLIFKRSKERPMRPLKIWLFDVSKQIVGGVVIHSLNLLAATLFGLSSEQEDSNPCIWYFLNIFLDTTFGVGVLYLFLKAADFYFGRMRIDGMKTGDYGNPPQLIRWWRQTLVFSLGLVVMKIVVVIVLTWPFLFTFGEWVLGWTLQNERLQIVFVMLILPLTMNICQFWVIDYILKQKPTEKFPIRIDEDDEDLYGLVGGLEHSYDEDGDDLDELDNQDSGFDHNRSSRPLVERLDLEEEDIVSKHQDSEYSQFPSGSNRRL
ncbi:MAG: vacuolar membrane protein-domain-containing protein [Benniella sp.]|nr:MAG: vacuolar membrane protein-domain-containing protein [Benniella sp.]